MGIKLTDIVPKEPIDWNKLENKKIAVDASNTIFQFLSSIRQADGQPLQDEDGNVTSHLVGLFSRVPNLMQKGLRLVFVFDGKPPELKYKERERRRNIKLEAEKKYQKATQEEDIESMQKYAKMSTRITSEMIEECKELLDALGIPVIQAPSEAEAQASFMVKKKSVWAVATQDYDALLFGAPRIIQNLTLAKKRKIGGGRTVPVTPQLLELKKVLDKLELDQEQLIVLGILVGTDYNIGGVKGLGPKKSLALVQQGKKFEEIFKELDIDFNWKEIMKIFKNIPVKGDYELEWKPIDEERIKKLLIEKHSFSEARVNNTLDKLKMKKNQTSLDNFF